MKTDVVLSDAILTECETNLDTAAIVAIIAALRPVAIPDRVRVIEAVEKFLGISNPC